ncbi:hypothetical protein [Mesorhizobium sp.]|uniref:hypothetical protein n=1 Tax=Mesorhizobium sp. TaxID=1871066 RepID=UPI0025795A1F|nr:hypothetical protein [Mesorhizobium sp.]
MARRSVQTLVREFVKAGSFHQFAVDLPQLALTSLSAITGNRGETFRSRGTFGIVR